jgi:hypothetical protein
LWARINREPGLESIAARKIDRLLDELSARMQLNRAATMTTSSLSEV